MFEGAASNGLWIVAAFLGLYLFWQLSRRVVRIGFLLMYFLVGALATYFFNPQLPVGYAITSGLIFTWTVMSIRSKIWKAISAAAIALAAMVAMPYLLGKKQNQIDESKPAVNQKKSQPHSK